MCDLDVSEVREEFKLDEEQGKELMKILIQRDPKDQYEEGASRRVISIDDARDMNPPRLDIEYEVCVPGARRPEQYTITLDDEGFMRAESFD